VHVGHRCGHVGGQDADAVVQHPTQPAAELDQGDDVLVCRGARATDAQVPDLGLHGPHTAADGGGEAQRLDGAVCAGLPDVLAVRATEGADGPQHLLFGEVHAPVHSVDPQAGAAQSLQRRVQPADRGPRVIDDLQDRPMDLVHLGCGEDPQAPVKT